MWVYFSICCTFIVFVLFFIFHVSIALNKQHLCLNEMFVLYIKNTFLLVMLECNFPVLNKLKLTPAMCGQWYKFTVTCFRLKKVSDTTLLYNDWTHSHKIRRYTMMFRGKLDSLEMKNVSGDCKICDHFGSLKFVIIANIFVRFLSLTYI